MGKEGEGMGENIMGGEGCHKEEACSHDSLNCENALDPLDFTLWVVTTLTKL